MLNWREVPFFRILLPFIIGISISLYVDQFFSLNNYLLVFLIAILAYAARHRIQFRWRWINGLLVNAFFLLLGYQIAFYHNDWNNKNHFKNYLEKENLVLGVVENTPGHNDRSIAVHLNTHQIGRNVNDLKHCAGTLLLRLRNDTIGQSIKYGDLLAVKVAAKSIQSNLNPEAFNFKRYLHFENIHYQGFISNNDWLKLTNDRGNPILAWAFKTRIELIKVLKNNLDSFNEYAVASALILGYKEDLSDELKNAYSSTGAMHVLAVSGLHTGLIWGIIAFLLKWFRWRNPAWHWIKTAITIVGLWLFALLTGASPSVLRAATMFSFLLIGTALKRNGNIYNTLAGSAFCLLLFDPYLIVSVGFQLSYLAVIGIVYFYKKIYNLWYIENRVGDYLWKLTVVAFAAQLSTFPLTMYYFHQFPIYFWLSGLIVVPFASLILGVGLSLFFVNWLVPILNTVFAKVLVAAIWLMNALIFLIEQLPTGLFKNIWIDSITMFLCYGIVGSIVFAINTKKIKWLILGMLMLTAISVHHAFQDINNAKNRMMVFYHLSGKSYVEFIEDKKIIALGDRTLEDKALKYATLNFHRKYNLKPDKRFNLKSDEAVFDHWFLQKDFVQFYDRKIAFVDRLPNRSARKKIKVDFVVFRKESKANVEQLSQFFEFDKIIFDGALSPYRILALKKECHDLNIPYHDTRQEGALIIDIN